MNLGPHRTEIRAQSAPWNRAIELLVTAIEGDKVSVAHLTLKPVDDFLQQEPTLRIDRDTAQTLMDDLWHAGIRPTEGTGSAGALAATQNHLKDLQRLVFAKVPPLAKS